MPENRDLKDIFANTTFIEQLEARLGLLELERVYNHLGLIDEEYSYQDELKALLASKEKSFSERTLLRKEEPLPITKLPDLDGYIRTFKESALDAAEHAFRVVCIALAYGLELEPGVTCIQGTQKKTWTTENHGLWYGPVGSTFQLGFNTYDLSKNLVAFRQIEFRLDVDDLIEPNVTWTGLDRTGESFEMITDGSNKILDIHVRQARRIVMPTKLS